VIALDLALALPVARTAAVAGKLTLIVAIWIGRLDIFSIIILLTPIRRLLHRHSR
jgi:Trk-type K+ transport system membrane component